MTLLAAGYRLTGSRYTVEAHPHQAPVPGRGRRKTKPGTPAYVRLHLTPAGAPWLETDPGNLRALAHELLEAAAWLQDAQP